MGVMGVNSVGSGMNVISVKSMKKVINVSIVKTGEGPKDRKQLKTKGNRR